MRVFQLADLGGFVLDLGGVVLFQACQHVRMCQHFRPSSECCFRSRLADLTEAPPKR